ncbi:methylenetetrahydrofolate reductase [NAD(P)H] [Parvularcula lutaonensis]|uniref:Methylenetetrahydrofolate reductase n=1 Tax=Parvularcula lutaonensis TaxID=491923 RepID=A0ABV7MAN4_9PROT|nr:methylenetetrahydrofolate reductase [NAD(P)H] [Parvularcula lutaonensis]GGY38203.1 methylenetetrahydrofolate reductase [Parvularcula lutaonensis]
MSDLSVSFEFFPPKTEAMAEKLWASVEKLAPLKPSFVSVTYGAGGSTRERTHATVEKIVQNTDLPVAAHLTTIDATTSEVDDVLRSYWDAGVRHIVALRGDPADGVGERYVPAPDGYAGAAELAAGAKRIADFEISVGCYPEKHPESPSFEHDIDLLKRKVDNGATRAITQFFYDNDVYERYVEMVRKAGIDIPIVPGIMPVNSFRALTRMAKLCNATVPARYEKLFGHLDDDPETRQLVAATVAAEQCHDLAERGVDHFHFYTLNKSELTYALCHMLGLRPKA